MKSKTASKTDCMRQFDLLIRQVEFENESAMLGLSPKSRRDLIMAADILQDYSQSALDPDTQPYDRIQRKQIEDLLSDFRRVMSENTV